VPYHRSAADNGFVTTLAQRRRNLKDIKSIDTSERKYAERQAVNSIVQGSASDVMKFAMLEIERELNGRYQQLPEFEQSLAGVRVPTLILQVHDELIFDVPRQFINAGDESATGVDFVGLLRECMERRTRDVFSISVPLVVKVKTGLSWGQIE
jgi:DNA polymerase-1